MILKVPSHIPITPDNVTKIPFAQKISPENIPEDLKRFKRFTVWKPVWADEGKKDRVRKVPYDRDGNICEWKDPSNLMSFSEALGILKTHPEYGGLQYALFRDVGVCGIDYDENVIDAAGNIKPEILKDLQALHFPYTEVSPSGKGLRVFLFGSLPQAQYHEKSLPEFYWNNKLLTLTGHYVEGTQADLVRIANNSLVALLRTYYPEDTVLLPPDKIPRTRGTYSDKEILSMIQAAEEKEDPKVTFGLKPKEGDFKAAYYTGKDIKDDPSATDYFVIRKIAYRTQDIKQIYRLMWTSELRREKWKSSNTVPAPWEAEVDKAGLSQTYLTRSICKALSSLSTVYKEIGSGEFYHNYKGYSCEPFGIYRKKKVKRKVRDEDTDGTKDEWVDVKELLCATPAYVSATGYNSKTGDFYVKLTYKNYSGHLCHKWMQPEDLTITKNLLSLANELAINDKSAKTLVEYFQLSITEAAQKPPEPVYSAVGWQDDHSCYVLGNRKITADGIEDIVPLGVPMADKLTTAGTIEGYAEAGKILMKYDVLRVKFYAMMSSLLLDLVYSRNITITHVATSGNLKGDSSYWIMGAFGHPVKLQLNPSSSNKGLQGHIALMSGLPTSVEELTGHAKILKEIQYHTTSGVERTTSSRNQDLKGGNLLRGIVCANSETPIFDSQDRLGNNIRNFNLDEPITEILSNEEILKLEDLINNNYGYAAEILIHLILQEKDNLMKLMLDFEKGLPAVEGIPENRFKNMCAFITLSGYFCEKLFSQIGIPTNDPLKLVSKFMLQNLDTGITEPLYVKALKVLAEHYIRYKPDFQDPEIGLPETKNRRGYEERNCIAFLPSEFKTVMNSTLGTGQAEATLKEFKRLGDILQTKDKGKLRARHAGIAVYKIKLEAFKKYTDFDLEAAALPDSEPSATEFNPEPDSEQKQKEASVPYEAITLEPDTETTPSPMLDIDPAHTVTTFPSDMEIPEFVDGNYDYSHYLNSGGRFPD